MKIFFKNYLNNKTGWSAKRKKASFKELSYFFGFEIRISRKNEGIF